MCTANKVADLDKQLINAILELETIIPKAYLTSPMIDESIAE